VDRITAGPGNRTRLVEAIETAVRLSGGTLIVSVVERPALSVETAKTPGVSAQARSSRAPARGSSRTDDPTPIETPGVSGGVPLNAQRSTLNERLYSAKYACPDCGLSYEPPSPQLFSFNSPLGMCPDCTGLGTRHEFLLERVVEDETTSIAKGALNLLGKLSKVGRWRRHIYQG